MIPEDDKTVCILLASYNGEKFIGDQLDSLLAQSYTKWRLFIRDDESTDETVSIVNRYAAKDTRISLIKDDKKKLGSCQNFNTLMSAIQGKFEYIMFCDQDDFWLPFKIEETLSQLRQAEKNLEEKTPCLVYTNFQYANSSLHIIRSKKNFQSTKVSRLRFAHLLAQNPVYGCTMMINKELASIIHNIPKEAENHDYWVALTASAFGKIFYFNKKTILYRQHDNNISTNYDNDTFAKRFKRNIVQRKISEDIQAKLIMAKSFKNIYYSALDKINRKILDNYINLFTTKGFFLLLTNLKNGVRRQTLSQTILFYITLILMKKNDVTGKDLKIYER